jgi:hypothetical protein
MENPSNKRTLLAAYRVPGFRTQARVDGYEDHHPAFVITLVRRQKKQYVAVAEKVIAVFMIDAGIAPEISIVVIARSILTLKGAMWTARCAAG